MKLKRTFRGLLAVFTLMAPLSGVLPGCSGPDNPTPTPAPPPPPPKAEEVKVPKTSSGQGTYGASEKYQKAMERAAKGGVH
jgi:hypothetical protein